MDWKAEVRSRQVGDAWSWEPAVGLTREDESVNGNMDCLRGSVLPTNLHIWYQFY